MAKALAKKGGMSGATKAAIALGVGVAVIGAGIGIAIALEKPAAASPPSPQPPGPQPPGPQPPAPVVNPTSYTFQPGHRYRVTMEYSVGPVPIIPVNVAQNEMAQMVGAPVVVVAVTKTGPNALSITFDYKVATPATAQMPPVGAGSLLTSLTIEDLGAIAGQ
jgi:hypothetical protein